MNQEEKLLLRIIGNYFESRNTFDLKNISFGKLLLVIKNTAMDGIFYQVLKDKNVPENFLRELKLGYEGIKYNDVQLSKIPSLFEKSKEKIIILKEWNYKKPNFFGLRYSCDIDLFVNTNKPKEFDKWLWNNDFLLEGVDIVKSLDMIEFAWSVNKDVSKNLLLKKYEEKKISDYLKSIKSSSQKIITLGNRLKFYEKHSKIKGFNYYFKDGSFVDIHYDLFSKEFLDIDINELKKEKIKGNLFRLKNEDSIVIDACHFVFSILKYSNKAYFHGFLKYLVDFEFKNNDVDWERITYLSNKFNVNSYVWFYLYLAKKNLNSQIPDKFIFKLGKKVSFFEKFLLKNISSNLLFNKQSLALKLYCNIYLK